MDCSHYEELICRQLDETLDETEQTLLQAHLEQCPHCRSFHAVLSGITEDLHSDREDPPAELLPGVMSRIKKPARTPIPFRRRLTRYAAMAACAALAVGAAGFGTGLFGGKASPARLSAPMFLAEEAYTIENDAILAEAAPAAAEETSETTPTDLPAQRTDPAEAALPAPAALLPAAGSEAAAETPAEAESGDALLPELPLLTADFSALLADFPVFLAAADGLGALNDLFFGSDSPEDETPAAEESPEPEESSDEPTADDASAELSDDTGDDASAELSDDTGDDASAELSDASGDDNSTEPAAEAADDETASDELPAEGESGNEAPSEDSDPLSDDGADSTGESPLPSETPVPAAGDDEALPAESDAPAADLPDEGSSLPEDGEGPAAVPAADETQPDAAESPVPEQNIVPDSETDTGTAVLP